MADLHAQPTGKKPAFNETAAAIVGSLVIGAILATLLTGNPFRALTLAYLDYSHTPANADVPIASDTRGGSNTGNTR